MNINTTTYAIKIFDKDNKPIAELMTASQTDILKFINKGFCVIDKNTGLPITADIITSNIGVSDGVIDVG